ncbi:DNA topoisomerase I [Lewinellaceae bacterium SD302]|nr:DNA topoisomerase I [Lewinellaceae bacterium SD302]
MGVDVYLAAYKADVPALKQLGDDQPGYTRLPWGKGFTYRCAEGKTVKDPVELARLKALVLPPAWTDVWICADPDGYLQATGRDARGRKQYRYHPDWTAYQQALKFSRMSDFVRALVPARKQISEILHDRSMGWNRRRVTALAIAVLDETGMRIGNKNYQRRNGTTGLTTIRRKHLEIDEEGLHFDYVGKSNKNRSVEIDDPELIELVRNLSDQPGYEVFRYRGNDGKLHSIDSADVNELIHELVGPEHSAKSFRTWAGTAAAIEFYPDAQLDLERNPRKRIDTCLIERVAAFLGNTTSICREYYIHPLVLSAVDKGTVPTYDKAASGLTENFLEELDEGEVIAYYLLRS